MLFPGTAEPYDRTSEVFRNVVRPLQQTGLTNEPIGEGAHAYLRFTGCRVPAGNLPGEPGTGFAIAQTRLSGRSPSAATHWR